MKRKQLAFVIIVLLAVLLASTAGAEFELKGRIVSFPRGHKYAVYSGPGTNYFRNASGKAVVSTNDWIEVYGFDHNWALIRYDVSKGGERFGYIEARYVPSKVVIGTLTFDNVETVIVNPSFLTDDPLGIQSSMANLPAGTRVLALAHMGEWTYVEYSNMRGFVRSSDVQLQGEPANAGERQVAGYALTNRDNVNVRELADKNSRKITTIPKSGTQVNVNYSAIGVDGYTWYNVGTPDGLVGFIRDDFLNLYLQAALIAPSNPTAAPAPELTAAPAADSVPINETNFPDAIFRQMVSDEFDLDHDGFLSRLEIEDVTEIYFWYSSDLLSLQGIEFFTNLRVLDGGLTSLSSLDVSNNTRLEQLYCQNNALEYLNLGSLPCLEELNCELNALSQLDISGCPNLTQLLCGGNQLTRLDMQSNLSITILGCQNNQLQALDVTMLQSLTELHCFNNDLRTLKLKNPLLIRIDCENNSFTELDISGCTALVNLVGQSERVAMEMGIDSISIPDGYFTLDHGVTLITAARMEEIAPAQNEQPIPNWATSVSGNSMEDAYLNVLMKYKEGIIAYERYEEADYQQVIKYEKTTDAPNPLYTLLLDVTGDERPELLFMCATDDSLNSSLGETMMADCYVFSWLNERAECILRVPHVYIYAGNGPWYEIYRSQSSNDLYFHYTCNGPGTTERYVLSDQGYYNRWKMADALFRGGESEDEEYYYSVDDVKGVTRAEYEDAIRLMAITDKITIVETTYSSFHSYGIMTYEEMMDYLRRLLDGITEPMQELAEGETLEDNYDDGATTKVNNVNVRSEASTKSKKVTTIGKKGTRVTVISKTRGQDGYDWFYIETSKGKRGYIRGDFLEISQALLTALEAMDPGMPAEDSQPPEVATEVPVEFSPEPEVIPETPIPEILHETYAKFVNEQFISGKYQEHVDPAQNGVYSSHTLMDIDKDGIEELIVYTLIWKGEIWVYTCEGGNVIPLEFEMNNDIIPEYIFGVTNCAYGNEWYGVKGNAPGILVGSYEGAGSHDFSHYRKTGHQMIRYDNAYINYDFEMDIELNGRTVSYDEMDDFFSQFDIPDKAGEENRLIDYFLESWNRWYSEHEEIEYEFDETQEADQGFEDYEAAYRTFMNNGIDFTITGSEQIDIDQDGIPELVIYSQLSKGEAWFYTYDGKVSCL